MRTCAYTECGREFEPKAHNQRYCTDECCRRATNARLMEQYYANKERRRGRARVCKTPGCGTLLSRYNESRVCQACESAIESAARQQLLKLVARGNRAA